VADKEEKILNELKAILSRILKIKVEEIKFNSKLQDDLGIDSVDFWDVISSIEKKFKYRIPDKIAAQLETVQDVVSILSENAKI